MLLSIRLETVCFIADQLKIDIFHYHVMPVAKPPPLVPTGCFEGRRPKSQPHPIGYSAVQEAGSPVAAAVDNSLSHCPDGYMMSDIQPLIHPPPGSPAISDSSLSYFNTHSPPLLNLSPNLSPAPNVHRVSPGYDLRESTRRQSLHGMFCSLSVIYVDCSCRCCAFSERSFKPRTMLLKTSAKRTFNLRTKLLNN